MTELEKIQIEKEEALILLTQVVEKYTSHDKEEVKVIGSYVYNREVLEEKVNKFFRKLGL
tara:strand:- start:89 stop:268 length:180 start_codon:yes stop_codon:yes gene_type:complete